MLIVCKALQNMAINADRWKKLATFAVLTPNGRYSHGCAMVAGWG